MTQLMTFFSNLNVMSLYKESLALRVYCYLPSYRKQHFAVHCNETVSPEISLPTLIFNPPKIPTIFGIPKKKKSNLSGLHYPQKCQDYILQPMILKK